MKKYTLFLLILIFALGFISVSSSNAAGLATKLKGKILLQVEQNGEAWYVSPKDEKRYFMGRPDDAFNLMREQGVGITNSDLYKISIGIINEGYADTDGDGLSDYLEDTLGLNKENSDTDGDGYLDAEELNNGYSPWDSGKQPLDNNFSKAQAGKILLQVEKNGEAWYVNPENNKRYFLGRPNDAFSVMRNLGLGITDNNLKEISISSEVVLNTENNDNDNDNKVPYGDDGIDTSDDECSSCAPYTLPGCPDGALVYQGKDDCGCFLPPLCDETLIDDEDENSVSVPASFDSCTTDSDCVSVNMDCCGCNAGGMASVINPYYLDTWNDTILGECDGYECTAVMSQHISCFSDAQCINNTCVLTPNTEEVCASDSYSNCQAVEEDELDDTKDEYGTSCQEILDVCN